VAKGVVVAAARVGKDVFEGVRDTDGVTEAVRDEVLVRDRVDDAEVARLLVGVLLGVGEALGETADTLP